jgi:hypothetical protein
LKDEDLGSPVDGAEEREEDDEDAGTEEPGGTVELAMAARYWMTFLVFSVLPAPDSPLCESALFRLQVA